MWTISLPLRVPVSKRKFFTINLNPYRNAHFQTLDRAKKSFHEVVKGLVRGIPRLEKISLEYILYPGTRQLRDISNVCSIADKFFSDSLVACGIIEDDNYNFIVDLRYRFGHVDRENPRVDVIIRNVLEPEKESKETMEIKTKTVTVVTIEQADLEDALREFLTKHFEIGTETEISLSTTKDGKYEVTLEEEATGQIGAGSAAKPTKQPVQRKPAKVKLEPKEAMAAMKQQMESAMEAAKVPSEPHQVSEPEAADEPEEETGAPVPAPKGGLFANVAKQPQPVEDFTPVEGEPQGAEDEPEPTEPPRKATSLFASFKRPSN